MWVSVVVAAVGGLILADRLGVFGRAPLGDFRKYHKKTFLVVRVIDGDTFDVDIPDGQYARTRIRLWGVDTPETVKPETPAQHFGHQASQFSKGALLGKKVRLELDRRSTRGTRGRLLAFVYLPDERMLNRVLVADGYAYADPRYEHRFKAEFGRLQTAARTARVGLWSGVQRSDLPYYYRGKVKLPANQQ